MKKDLLTIQEAAIILGVSTKTLRRWDEGKILVPHRTKGNQRRYLKDEVVAFRDKKKFSRPFNPIIIPQGAPASQQIQPLASNDFVPVSKPLEPFQTKAVPPPKPNLSRNKLPFSPNPITLAGIVFSFAFAIL